MRSKTFVLYKGSRSSFIKTSSNIKPAPVAQYPIKHTYTHYIDSEQRKFINARKENNWTNWRPYLITAAVSLNHRLGSNRRGWFEIAPKFNEHSFVSNCSPAIWACWPVGLSWPLGMGMWAHFIYVALLYRTTIYGPCLRDHGLWSLPLLYGTTIYGPPLMLWSSPCTAHIPLWLASNTLIFFLYLETAFALRGKSVHH